MKQINVLFICHGNICRSPMGRMILSELVRREGLGEYFKIDSCATSSEEICNPIYPPAKRTLERHNIPVLPHRARRITRRDGEEFDYLIYMERYHESAVKRAIGAENAAKAFRLLDFTDSPRDIDDPWYTGEFEKAYAEIEEGCLAFLRYLQANRRFEP